MVKYDWDAIARELNFDVEKNRDPILFLDCINFCLTGKLYSQCNNLKGIIRAKEKQKTMSSYLLNYTVYSEMRRYSKMEGWYYFYFSSKRLLQDYQYKGLTCLDTFMVEPFELDFARHNKHLTIQNDKIYFNYER
jgi:hypothetical protein